MEGLGQSNETWARHLSELVHHLEDVARAHGRDVDIPEPLFFADLLGILRNLEVAPAEFFRGVIRRWAGDPPPVAPSAPK